LLWQIKIEKACTPLREHAQSTDLPNRKRSSVCTITVPLHASAPLPSPIEGAFHKPCIVPTLTTRTRCNYLRAAMGGTTARPRWLRNRKSTLWRSLAIALCNRLFSLPKMVTNRGAPCAYPSKVAQIRSGRNCHRSYPARRARAENCATASLIARRGVSCGTECPTPRWTRKLSDGCFGLVLFRNCPSRKVFTTRISCCQGLGLPFGLGVQSWRL
jgi:hypothetical protein